MRQLNRSTVLVIQLRYLKVGEVNWLMKASFPTPVHIFYPLRVQTALFFFLSFLPTILARDYTYIYLIHCLHQERGSYYYNFTQWGGEDREKNNLLSFYYAPGTVLGARDAREQDK